MPKLDASNTSFQGALIVNGFIPEDELWNELNELLIEIEDLPQPILWNGLCGLQLYISVHREKREGGISPPLNWAASALAPPRACAAIAFECKPLGDKFDQDLYFGFSECLFHDFALTFALAANIARPGCFRINSIIMQSSDGSYEEKPGIVHDLDGAVAYSQKTGWPPLVPVSFGRVYWWIVHNAFHMRTGDTPVSRAFNAYTWLFGEPGSDFSFSLVATLIGIEALFATTTSGVADQVRRRAQLLLGSRTSFTQDLREMYSARSAFLHGGTLLPPNGFLWSPPKTKEITFEKISSANNVASAVLLSSLQRLVEKGWNTLEFSENLMGSDKEELLEELIQGTGIWYADVSEVDNWMARFIRRFD